MKARFLSMFAAFLAMMLGASQSAFAALPAAVGTAATTATTDGLEAVGILAGFGAGVFLIVVVLRRLGIIK